MFDSLLYFPTHTHLQCNTNLETNAEEIETENELTAFGIQEISALSEYKKVQVVHRHAPHPKRPQTRHQVSKINQKH